MQIDDDQWISPSFNSYSQKSELAGEVAGEAAGSLTSIAEKDDRNVSYEEDDFEFSLILNEELEVSSSNFIPIFDRQLLGDFELENIEEKKVDINSIKVPLSRLFIEEREEDHQPPSPPSEDEEGEGDDVESIPPGKYCVWRPKVAAPSPTTCRKSKSTGFGSKRWKLRDLLRRSNSEGKDSFVFLTPKKKEVKSSGFSNAAKSSSSSSGLGLGSSPSPSRSMVYSPVKRGNGEMPKRKSYLPYRQDLVGFFTTVNSIGRNFSPL